jgi:CRISPR system Cascade subunit CasD
VLAALRSVALAERAKHQPKAALEACWPAHLGGDGRSRETAVYDRRDWRNQIHAGRRLRVEGLLELPA